MLNRRKTSSISLMGSANDRKQAAFAADQHLGSTSSLEHEGDHAIWRAFRVARMTLTPFDTGHRGCVALIDTRRRATSAFSSSTWVGRRTRYSERRVELELASIGFLHITDDGLPTLVHMNMLNADNLLTAVAQASKNLNLRCISPH
jgi:hypothetical protein